MNASLQQIAARLDFSEIPRPADSGQLLCAVAVTALLALLVLLAIGGPQALFAEINAPGRYFPEVILQSFTYTGDTLFACALMLILARRYPQMVWTAFIAALIATLLSHGCKSLLQLPRPAAVLEAGSFHLVGPGYRARSFPSGHATTAFVLGCVFACFLHNFRARNIALLIATLVGGSRILVGAHWPIDVAGGAITAALSVWLALRAAERWHWGMRLHGHLILVAMLTASTLVMALTIPPYPQARAFAHSVAIIALGITLWNYLILPQLLLRAARDGSQQEGT